MMAACLTAHHLAPVDVAGDRRQDLHDPVVNLGLGQEYLRRLLADPAVDNNLFMMAIAYNAGPGTLAKWRAADATQDALLFIESLPKDETRTFVERVMATLAATPQVPDAVTAIAVTMPVTTPVVREICGWYRMLSSPLVSAWRSACSMVRRSAVSCSMLSLKIWCWFRPFSFAAYIAESARFSRCFASAAKSG